MKKFLILPLIALIITACSSAKEQAEEATEDYLKDYTSEYTQGELEAFRDELSTAINNMEYDKLDQLIDIKAMFFRGYAKVGKGEQFVNRVDKILSGANFTEEFIGNLNSGFDYVDFIQVDKAEDNMRLLTYRCFSVEGGINYVKFLVAKNGENLKAIDIFVVMTGEYMGETIFNLMSQMMGSKTSGTDARAFTQAKNQYQMGQVDQALVTLNSIPKESPMRDTKAFKVFELSIIGDTDDWKAYTQAISEYRDEYPNDASAELVSVDYYLMRNEYDKCLESLKILQEQFPTDGGLDYILGTIYFLKGDCDLAKEKFNKSLESFPNEPSISDMILAVDYDCGEEMNMQELMESEF